MVGPVVVRRATTDLRATGQGVGAAYAVSTAGSLAGTLVTAFIAIPAFETDQILVGTATILVLMGAIPHGVARPKGGSDGSHVRP
jgi:hypothetical protein